MSKIPEWAKEEGLRRAMELVPAIALTYDHSHGLKDADQRERLELPFRQIAQHEVGPAIALALVDAERRGASAKADTLNVVERALKDWLHIYAPDLCDPAEVEAAKARVHDKGTIAYIAAALAAIRQLGEE